MSQPVSFISNVVLLTISFLFERKKEKTLFFHKQMWHDTIIEVPYIEFKKYVLSDKQYYFLSTNCHK